jgi:protein-disulfide isomerase
MTFIGPDSVRSAQALEAAGLQNKMWNAADIVYYNHGQENSGYMDDAYLKRTMGAVPGLDVSKALSQRNSSQVTSALREVNPLAQRYGVNSTPSFLVGPSGGSLTKVHAPSASAADIGKAIDKVAKG